MSPANPQFPSIVHGKFTSSKRNVGEVTVRIRNESTGDVQDVVTDRFGRYLADAANFVNGYTVGDTVTVSLKNAGPEFEDNIRVSNGKIELK